MKVLTGRYSSRSHAGKRFRGLIRRSGVLLGSLSIVFLSSCAYSFAGGGLPPNIRTMAIATFDNQTPSPELPKELYDQMRSELQKRLGVRDAPQDRADAQSCDSLHRTAEPTANPCATFWGNLYCSR